MNITRARTAQKCLTEFDDRQYACLIKFDINTNFVNAAPDLFLDQTTNFNLVLSSITT